MKRNAIISLFLIFILGCSLFQPPKQIVKINTIEPGIIAYVNGEEYVTPNMIMVKRHKDVNIYCRKEGYHPYKKNIGHHFNVTGILDLAGTFIFIVPVIGLFTKGIWSLNTTKLTLPCSRNIIRIGRTTKKNCNNSIFGTSFPKC